MDWEIYRNLDGTLDLVEAFKNTYPLVTGVSLDNAISYLESAQALAKISSRQVAATLLVSARQFTSLQMEASINSIL